MIVRNKKSFAVGSVFALSFLTVLLMIFSPLFGGRNGLQFADESFNKLSKGSSYFIPKISETVKKHEGREFSVTFRSEDAAEREAITGLLTASGAGVEEDDSNMTVTGDLGGLLQNALSDADHMFKNDGKTVSEKYGADERKVLRNWWIALNNMEKGFKKAKSVEEAKIVSDVTKKAVEPAYNFYQVEGEKVVDHAGMMSGLLVFYVAYTMWWGYAIFYLFEGVGLTMKKSRVKREA